MKISVITITYNSAETLEETIQSVMDQNYEDMEYLIIDGGSTDTTVEIIRQYENVVTRWVSEPDRGISDAFNKGIGMATGDIICLINSDDLLAANALRTVAAQMKEETDVLYGSAIYFGENQKSFRVKPHDNIENLRKYMCLVHPAVFVRKRAYDKYGCFDLSYQCAMDRELLTRMYLGGARFQRCKADLAWMRMGGVSMKSYLHTTVPEEVAISIKYGLPSVQAKWMGFKLAAKYIVAKFLRKLPFSDLIRKYFHAKTTELDV